MSFLNIISIFFFLTFDNVIFADVLVTTTRCEYYNETICKDSSAECETEHVDECNKNHTNHCYVVWSNNTKGVISIKYKGCFSDNKNCEGKQNCVEQAEYKKSGLFRCCCEGDMCNKDFFWNPTPSPTVTERIDVSLVPRNMTVIIIMVTIPVLTICALILAMVFRRQRKLYLSQIPDSEEDSECPSPSRNKLLSVELDVVKAQGRFGAVWTAHISGEPVAVKIMPVQHKQSWLAEEEVYKLPLMNHDNVLRFIAAEKRGDTFQIEYWLITEYHKIGSLCDFLKSNTITWEQLCNIAYTMTRGLMHLHEEIYCEKEGLRKPSIAHRDFKSKNVLIKDDLTACIADFGLAVIFRQGESCSSDTHRQVGTTRYMAPEVLDGSVFFSKHSFLRMDMYACGLVLWELVSRCSSHEGPISEYKLPYEEELGQHPSIHDLQEFVVWEKHRPVLQDSWKSHVGLSLLCDTIEECWDKDAESRLTATCVMERIAWYIRPHTNTTPVSNIVVNKFNEESV